MENTQLIESLTKTKVKAAEIADALRESTEMSMELNRQRDAYKPFAKTGARLYFLTQGLRMKNHMYQFSLPFSENSIISPRSVVTQDIPDYCIAVGNPARVIKKINH